MGKYDKSDEAHDGGDCRVLTKSNEFEKPLPEIKSGALIGRAGETEDARTYLSILYKVLLCAK